MDKVRPSMEAAGMDVFATAKNVGWELGDDPMQEYGVWEDHTFRYSFDRACADRIKVNDSDEPGVTGIFSVPDA